ncbi:hypothetical protein C6381_22710 [Pseudomonas syringae pv. actinidiae]|nr:hypothetical protein C6381_22710 [Pseudomonas syringae pv. actinidiae]
MIDENALRQEICDVGRLLYGRGYTVGSAGNISARLDDGWLITPTDACLGRMDPADIAKVNLAGEWVSGSKPSKTLALHREVYDRNPEVGGVVHTHSTHLVALTLAYFGWQQLDAYFGLGIALYILWSALQIARETVSVLMDEELPADVSTRMLELARSVPGVLGAHDLRTRISGNHWFVQLHLELPGTLTLSVAHALCDQAADAIHQQFPKAEVLVHADPQEGSGRQTPDPSQLTL